MWETRGQGEGTAWREQVLDQTLRWAQRLGLILSTIGTVSLLLTNPERFAHPLVWIMLGSFGGTLLLRRPSLSHQRRAQLFCGLVLATGISSVGAMGLLPGAVLCNALAVVSAGAAAAHHVAAAGHQHARHRRAGGVERGPLHHIERSLQAAERVLAETQTALQRSQKLEAVGRLAAGVGHDFNNSLQVVLSWASLLQARPTRSTWKRA